MYANLLLHLFLCVLCLFKVFCLVEVSSKSLQEKTTILMFSLDRVPLVQVN